MLNRIMTGFSRFPVHEPGRPQAFVGLLLVKKVRLVVDVGCDAYCNPSF